MRIAFTYNMKRSDDEAEAEFDTPSTVALITEALTEAGHDVRGVEARMPLLALVESLRSFSPDLVFNTAEGVRGKIREAFYPALFDELEIPHTGSDPHCYAVTLDKYLTNLVVERAGVRAPRCVFVTSLEKGIEDYPFPCIVKPNFEGSSKGITDASVVTDRALLQETVSRALTSYPDGVLVQEFIPGMDVVVPYVEGLGTEVLSPCAYEYNPTLAGEHRIYSYRLKHEAGSMHDAITMRCPADLPPDTQDEIRLFSWRAVKALGIRNLARFDFRVREDGVPFFIEANANPSLEEGASPYLAAAEQGLTTPAALLGHVVWNAFIQQAVTKEDEVEDHMCQYESACRATFIIECHCGDQMPCCGCPDCADQPEEDLPHDWDVTCSGEYILHCLHCEETSVCSGCDDCREDFSGDWDEGSSED